MIVNRLFLLISIIFVSLPCFSFEEQEGDVPEFVTPANMSSSYDTTPNSVSIIDEHTLEALGIDNFIDALRLIPGMVVAETHGSRAAVGYHGTNVNVPRRADIRYNSSLSFRPGYAEALWYRMPLIVEDLEKIEVVRGSSSADYGANAMTATINMIQKPVALQKGVSVSAKSDQDTNTSARLRLGFDIADTKNSLAISHVNSEGFDESSNIDTFDDSYHGTRLLLNGELELSRGLLDWNLGASNFEYEFPAFDNLSNSNSEVELQTGAFSNKSSTEDTLIGSIKYSNNIDFEESNADWNIGFNHYEFERKQDLIFCYPSLFYDPILGELDRADNIHLVSQDLELLVGSSAMFGQGMLDQSILAPLTDEQQLLLGEFGSTVQAVGIEAVTKTQCGVVNQNTNESRQAIHASYKHYHPSGLTFSSKIAVREDIVDSQTYMNGVHKRTSYEWSNNARYKVLDNLVVNLGVMSESNSDIDKTYFSPRFAINFQPLNKHVIRALISQSRRIPNIHETERAWQYTIDYINGETDYYERSTADFLRMSVGTDLKPEKLDTKEISYTFYSHNTVFDIKYFHEKYDNLISEPFSYIDFNLTNNGEATVSGSELELNYSFNNGMPTRVGVSLTYLDIDANNEIEETLYSPVFGSVWSIIEITESTKLGLVYFGSTEQAKNSYDRYDLNIIRTFTLDKGAIDLTINYRHYPENQANYTEYSSTDPFTLGYENQDRFSISVKLSF